MWDWLGDNAKRVASLIALAGLIAAGMVWAQNAEKFHQTVEQTLQEIVDWQKAKEKQEIEEKARQSERTRIEACLQEGKTIEDCLE